ncbi:MAG: aldehyde dehydrogenase family protein [Achromobacter pulmonis]
MRQALGVVAGITPFNFPVMVPCGCSRWPSPAATPSCSSRPNAIPRASLRLAELLNEAGLPPGVFNVVHGDKEAVDALIDAPRRRGPVSFVGSTPIADYIYAERHPSRQARAGPGRRQEPHGGDARRRPRPGRRRADGRRPTARPASAAWRSRWRWRWATWPTR